MKNRKVTYGVYGMMEYQSVVKMGKSLMKVQFSDGSVSALGVTPARFTTENPVTQMAIENSVDFKRGLVKVVNEIDLEGEVKVMRNSTVTDPRAKPSAPDSGGEGDGQPGEARTEAGEEDAEESGEESGGHRLVFACNDDAREYLESNYGVIRNHMRTRQDIVTVGAQRGLEIVFE